MLATTALAVKTPCSARLAPKRPIGVSAYARLAPDGRYRSGEAGFGAPASAFFQVTSGHVRLVAQQQQPPMLLGFVKEARLLLEHPQRLDVGRHRPSHPQVRCLANEVASHRAR